MIARRRCDACQAPVSRKAAWCPSCGAALAAPEAVAPQSVTYLWVTWVLAALLVLTLVASYVVFHSDRVTSVASDGTQTSSSLRAALLQRASDIGKQAFTLTGPTLARDLAAAETLMTPAMAAKFACQLDATARSTLVKRGEVHQASVVKANDGRGAVWVVSMTADSAQLGAVLLVKTTIKGGKGELDNLYPLRIDLTQVNGAWLASNIARLDAEGDAGQQC